MIEGLQKIEFSKDLYLTTAEKHHKEWFEDDHMDFVLLVPLVARDYLAALLYKYEDHNYRMPDMDLIYDAVLKYDPNISKFEPLNMDIKKGLKDIDFYLPLLNDLRDYVRQELN